jgi:hypothetical protein
MVNKDAFNVCGLTQRPGGRRHRVPLDQAGYIGKFGIRQGIRLPRLHWH